MAPGVSVVIPWRAVPAREAAMALVWDYFSTMFDGWELIRAEHGGDAFSRAQALNAGAQMAKGNILLRNDADSIVEAGAIMEAVRQAMEAPGQVKAYTRYRKITHKATVALRSWRDVFALSDSAFDWEMEVAQSHGCVAMRIEDFLEVGGYDPRFVGWGYEDLALDIVVQSRWPARRIDAELRHIWHDADPTTDPDHPLQLANLALFDRYQRATGDLDLLAAIRQEADG